MKRLRRDFLKVTGMLGLGAFVAACKNGSIARTVLDAGVPDKTDLMMPADRPPLLETLIHRFLQDPTPNDAYFVRWHPAGLPTLISPWNHGLIGRPWHHADPACSRRVAGRCRGQPRC
jgi:hypothetical protein